MGRRYRRPRKPRAEIAVRVPPNTSIADAIKLRIARYYKAKGRMCFFELGLCSGGRLRADVLALAMNGWIVIIEIKSSVADFRCDKKMEKYEQWANQTYLSLPESVYEKVKDKILPGWGVFVMGEDGTTLKKVKGAKSFTIEEEDAKSILIRAAFRSADTNTTKNRQLT